MTPGSIISTFSLQNRQLAGEIQERGDVCIGKIEFKVYLEL